MEETKIKEIVSAVKAVEVGMLAMEAAGKYKLRQQIRLSDKELREYINTTKANIYTSIISNLVLQDVLLKELDKPAKLKKYNDGCLIIQTALEAAGLGGSNV